MKLSKRKEKALRQSIAHWERMANGKRRKMFNHDNGEYELEVPDADFCSLCVMAGYNPRINKFNDCKKCPVFMKTGLPGCDGTPYDKALDVFLSFGIDSDEFKEAAQEEVDFLKSLL